MNTRNSYNRNQYQSSRYNNPGTFIPAVQPVQQPQQQQYPAQQQHNQNQGGWKIESPSVILTPVKQAFDQQQQQQQGSQDVEMDNNDSGDVAEEAGGRKKWMKKGVAGFKVSMRERRRRQNRQLRRLITPKNALMVLNELTPGSQHECTVLPEAEAYTGAVAKQYVAVLNVEGIEYRGTGSSKLQAKNSAAEGVIRDMIIKQMGMFPEAAPAADSEMKMESEEEKGDGEPTFPMIQLASYALHKLFSDWQTEGFKVPQLTPTKSTPPADNQSVVSVAPKAPRKPPVLPPNAEALHPCMLLSQMRGALTYNFLACEGIKPNSQIFSMGVTVDGTTYIGKAPNKKEARKLAAQKACAAIFKVAYPDEEKKVPIEDM